MSCKAPASNASSVNGCLEEANVVPPTLPAAKEKTPTLQSRTSSDVSYQEMLESVHEVLEEEGEKVDVDLLNSLVEDVEHSELWRRIEELENLTKAFGSSSTPMKLVPGVAAYADLTAPPEHLLNLAQDDCEIRKSLGVGGAFGSMFAQERYRVTLVPADLPPSAAAGGGAGEGGGGGGRRRPAAAAALAVAATPLRGPGGAGADADEHPDASSPTLEECSKNMTLHLVKGKFNAHEAIPEEVERWEWDETCGLGKNGEKTILIEFGNTPFEPGDYTALVGWHGPPDTSVSVKTAVRLVRKTAAAEVAPGSDPLQMELGKGQYAFFRCKRSPGKLLTILARPLAGGGPGGGGGGPRGDPDLYVSNALAGLAGATADEYGWKDTGVGAARVDVHPGDPRAALGDVYLIGVRGCHPANAFELEVKEEDPEPIQRIDVGTSLHLDLDEGASHYLWLKVNSK